MNKPCTICGRVDDNHMEDMKHGMRFWRHNTNGRVGMYATKPSSSWHEIVKSVYDKEKVIQDALLA